MSSPSSTQVRLSLAMVAGKDSATIAAALRSAKPWVDEMVVVLRDSDEETEQIAEEHGATVETTPFVEHEAAALNSAIDACQGDWVILLHPWERIDGLPSTPLADLLPKVEDDKIQVYVLQCHHAGTDGVVTEIRQDIRVVPNNGCVGFIGAVDPQIDAFANECEGINAAAIPNLRLISAPHEERKTTRELLDLRQRELDANPKDPRQAILVAQSLLECGETTDAVAMLRNLRTALQDEGAPDLMYEACLSLLDGHRAQGTWNEQTRDETLEILDQFQSSAELWYRAACNMDAAGNLEVAVAMYRETNRNLDTPLTTAVSRTTVRCEPWKLFERWGRALANSGQLEDAYRILIEAVKRRPPEREGHAELLAEACRLGVDINSQGELRGMIEDLAERAEGELDPVFGYAQRLEQDGGRAAAVEFVHQLSEKCPRLRDAPQYSAWMS